MQSRARATIRPEWMVSRAGIGPASSTRCSPWEREWRGEIVLVIGPKPPVVDSQPNWEQLQQQVADLVADGMHQKEAIRRIASEMSLPKRDLYQFIVNRLHKED